MDEKKDYAPNDVSIFINCLSLYLLLESTLPKHFSVGTFVKAFLQTETSNRSETRVQSAAK